MPTILGMDLGREFLERGLKLPRNKAEKSAEEIC